MKKTLLVLLMLTACILFVGCGKKTENVEAPAPSAAPKHIGVSVPSADHGWTGGVVYWAEQAQKLFPEYRITAVAAKDATEQNNQIENLLAQGIDALVVLPHEPSPLTGICERVAKQGVYLVVVDRNLDKPVQNLSVVGDNPGFGRAGAEAIVKALNGKGKVVVMEGVPCQVNTDRVEAFKKVMAANPGIEVLDSQPTDWNTEKALKLMENYLQKYPQIDAVWAGDDDVLVGALKAYQESGRKDVRAFVGGAGAKGIVKKIMDKDPLVPFDVTYPPRMIVNGVENAIKGLKGEIPADTKTIVIPAEIITPENAKDFYYPDSVF